jgi:hypothetical protein
MSNRPLNSDKLGEKGKKRFGEICADAKLECNASDYDRTGWDFIVEFPFSSSDATGPSLEERAKPLSCHVQLKTIWEDNDKISMRLTSAEHLAKELKPSFIYVFKVSEALEVTGAYLIHLLYDPLAKVLKRLRKEDIAGITTPNKLSITMSAAGDGMALAPTGQALRAALLAACGPDAQAYAEKKADQFVKLGFEERPYALKMSLPADSMEDLVDAFLGLKKEIAATNVESSQVRFGLKKVIPGQSDSAAKISIQPSAFDECTITVRSSPISRPAVFRGQVFRPAIPDLPAEQFKLLIKTELFQMVFKRPNWSISSTPPHPPQTLSDWAAYWRFAHVMATGSGAIQIVADNAPVNSTLNVTAKMAELDPERCEWLEEHCEKAAALCKLAGVNEEPKVSIEQVVDRAKQISSASHLTTPGEGLAPAKFTTEIAKGLTYPYVTDMIYMDYLPLGDVMLGYYGVSKVTGTLSGEQIEWNTDNVELKNIVRLYRFPEDFEKLREQAQKETGCGMVWHREFAKGELEPADEAT